VINIEQPWFFHSGVKFATIFPVQSSSVYKQKTCSYHINRNNY